MSKQIQLLHADKNKNDIEYISSYSLDMAFGKDENNFELTASLGSISCESSDIIYIEGTEIGGIVDTISPSTKSTTITYKGRTAHGILDSYIIVPPKGYKEYLISGNSNEELKRVVEYCGIKDVDVLAGDDVSLNLGSIRYEGFYTGLSNVLLENGCRLDIKWHNARLQLRIVHAVNYATNEQFDSSKIKFTVEKHYNLPNHFICYGVDENSNDRVIHLFADTGGGVFSYATIDTPLKNADYILDERMKEKLDNEEYSEVVSVDDVKSTENYEVLKAKPADWDKNYPNYYTTEISEEDGSISYTNIERNTGDYYEKLNDKPADWDSNYTSYYESEYDSETNEYTYSQVSSDDAEVYDKLTTMPSDWYDYYTNYYYYLNTKKEYVQIEKVTQDTYTKVKKQPKDWDKKYGNYYTNDGTGKTIDVNEVNLNNNKSYGAGWSSVSANSKTVYKLLTRKPSDWSKNWGDYYVYSTNGIYITYSSLFPYETASLKKKKKTLKFEKNKFYYQSSKDVAPKFSSLGDVYSKKTTLVHPSFKEYSEKIGVFTYTLTKVKQFYSGQFYRKLEDYDFGFQFVANSFYKKVIDNYAGLVESGISRIQEVYSQDSTDIDLSELTFGYEINDIIGLIESSSGISINAPIVKKIITIEKNQVSVSYEV